jgi:myo-inositol-1(or 4)-monophosphatase
MSDQNFISHRPRGRGDHRDTPDTRGDRGTKRWEDAPRTEGRAHSTTTSGINNPALNVAVQAARAAGRIINIASNHLDRLTVEKKGQGDFVSEVDRAAETEIIELIRQNFPHHDILGEESGATPADPSKVKGKSEDYRWIIDPLDGTTNFLHGLPHFSISIALYQGNRPEVGVVYDPNRNELYTAVRGKGALLEQRRIRVSSRHFLPDVLMGTGFPFRANADFSRYLKQMEDLMKNTAGIRRAGSAALDLAFVAAGRLDGYWESGLSPWDVAAGALLVQEAGGMITDLSGNQQWLNQGDVLTANPTLHEKLLKRFLALV